MTERQQHTDAEESGTAAGRLVGGRYRLSRQLGAGGFGSVWHAHDETLGVDVAVKEVRLPPTASAAVHRELLERAQREARHAARLRDHPNIVGVHDVVLDGGAPWTVMQLIVGRSLQERIVQDGPLPTAEAARVGSAVLTALGAAHGAGIVHRDVKPANILLADDGRVLLADFGIAVQQDQTALTATGMFLGSVDYISPERAHGAPATPAGDLFALGATLYQAVEGRMPFRRDTPVATLTAVLFEPPAPPRLAGPLAPLIAGLLDKDPTARLTGAQAAALLAPHLQPAPPASAAAHPPTAAATLLRPGSLPATPVPGPVAPGPVIPHRPALPPRQPAVGTRSGPSGRRSPATVLPPLAVLLGIAAAMPLTAATVGVKDNGTLPPATIAAFRHVLSSAHLPLYQGLGVDRFPVLQSPYWLFSWLWLLPTLVVVIASAALPVHRHLAVRVSGHLLALVLPVRLLVADFGASGEKLVGSRLPRHPDLTLTFGPGWWLLHAAAFLAPAALAVHHLVSRREAGA